MTADALRAQLERDYEIEALTKLRDRLASRKNQTTDVRHKVALLDEMIAKREGAVTDAEHREVKGA